MPSDQTARTPRVACVVVTYNRDDFVDSCVASLLREHNDALPIEVTVINNGATDRTADVLAKIDDPRVSVRTKDTNRPLVLVLNECLEIGHASGADYILLLNDDIEMRPGAIAEMVAVCNEVQPSIVSPLQINYRKPDQIDGALLGRLAKSDELLNDALLKGETGRYYHQRSLIGAALLATPETFRAVGDFDPIFTFYGPDDDYSNRAREMGISLVVAMRAEMLHLHGKTEASATIDKKDWLRRWTTQYRGRMIFRLKSRERSLPFNYAAVIGQTLFDIPRYLLARFPGGSIAAARTLVELLKSYGQVARRRKEEDALSAAFKRGS